MRFMYTHLNLPKALLSPYIWEANQVAVTSPPSPSRDAEKGHVKNIMTRLMMFSRDNLIFKDLKIKSYKNDHDLQLLFQGSFHECFFKRSSIKSKNLSLKK